MHWIGNSNMATFKIRHMVTGLYSKGGMGCHRSQYSWSSAGKTWSRLGDLRRHLAFYNPHDVSQWEVICYDELGVHTINAALLQAAAAGKWPNAPKTNNGWFDWESRPVDGSFFLASDETHQAIGNSPIGYTFGNWTKDSDSWNGSFVGEGWKWWRPLPPLPTKKSKGKK